MMPTIIELIFCIIDDIILYRFGLVFLKKKKISDMSVMLMTLLTALIAFGMSYVEIYSGLTTIILFFSIVFFIFVVFEWNVFSLLAVPAMYFLFLGILTSLISSLVLMIFSLDHQVLFTNIAIRTAVALLIKVTMAVITFVAARLTSREKQAEVLKSKSLAAFLVLSFFMLLLLFEQLFVSRRGPSKEALNYLILLFTVFFVIIIMLIYLYHRNKEKSLKYDFLLKEIELKERASTEQIERNIEILHIKHDLKNHLISLRQLVKKDRNDTALSYISDILDEEAFKTYVSSKNDIINALLNTKIYENPDVKFNVRLDIDAFDFDSRHITVILGNALDNAISAVRKLPEQNHNIDVTLSESDEYGKIVITNPYLGDIKITDGLPSSVKENNRTGIGLLSISRILNECNGTMNYSTDDQVFRIVLLLKKA